jgi:hypothetical protein
MVKNYFATINNLAHKARKDNSNKDGLYLIGIEFKDLVYGFSERASLLEAFAELESKGYSGRNLRATFLDSLEIN